MDQQRILKLSESLSKGILTDTEVAHAVLSDLIAYKGDYTEVSKAIARYPSEVQSGLTALLQKIKDDGYIWNTFRFGTGQDWADPVILRKICNALLGH